MRIRWDPKGQGFPAIKGRLIVDTYRGQMRVRAWPRKTGTSKSQAVRDQNQWFKEANHMAKRIVAEQQNLAIAMTLGTGLYPRDLILRQMAGGLYDIVLPDGQEVRYGRFFRETKMFQGAILQLNSNFSLPVNVLTTINWPLPIKDTAGFWNVALPGRLTIPDGITVIGLTAGMICDIGGTNTRTIIEIFKNGFKYSAMDIRSISTPQITWARGAISVLPGDFFEMRVLQSFGSDAIGPDFTFFTLIVEEAT